MTSPLLIEILNSEPPPPPPLIINDLLSSPLILCDDDITFPEIIEPMIHHQPPEISRVKFRPSITPSSSVDIIINALKEQNEFSLDTDLKCCQLVKHLDQVNMSRRHDNLLRSVPNIERIQSLQVGILADRFQAKEYFPTKRHPSSNIKCGSSALIVTFASNQVKAKKQLHGERRGLKFGGKSHEMEGVRITWGEDINKGIKARKYEILNITAPMCHKTCSLLKKSNTPKDNSTENRSRKRKKLLLKKKPKVMGNDQHHHHVSVVSSSSYLKKRQTIINLLNNEVNCETKRLRIIETLLQSEVDPITTNDKEDNKEEVVSFHSITSSSQASSEQASHSGKFNSDGPSFEGKKLEMFNNSVTDAVCVPPLPDTPPIGDTTQ